MKVRNERDFQLIRDMLAFSQRTQRRIAGLSRQVLEANEALIGAALIYDIFVIGEAANHVSTEFKEQHPDIPWRSIIGMRNVLVHEYSNVNYDILWNVATRNIPRLIAQLEAILAATYSADEDDGNVSSP